MQNQFEQILLEPEQEALFIFIVETARSVPREKREKFFVIRIDDNGDLLIHPGIKNSKKEIYYGDIQEFERQGLVAIEFSSANSPLFDVTAFGFRYYEYLKKKKGEAVGRVEVTIKDYLDSSVFKSKYPEAFAKWSSAENLLWQTDTQQQLTTIGHLCREAVQEFTDALIARYQLSDVHRDKTQTVARLRAIFDLESIKLGETEKKFFKALLAYFGTVYDLIQRQEHGANKEGEQLGWEDARRVVFQTMVIIFEIDKTLT